MRPGTAGPLLAISLASAPSAPAAPARVYANPILPGDWSDPGLIRMGEYFYTVRSSLGWQPGLPIARSRDLLHREHIGYGFKSHPEQARARHKQGREPWDYVPGKADPARAESLMKALDARGACVEEVRVFLTDLAKPTPSGHKWDNFDPETSGPYPRHRIQGLSTPRFRAHMKVLADLSRRASEPSRWREHILRQVHERSG